MRTSTPGSMPATKYWRGSPRRIPRTEAAASSSLAGSAAAKSGTGSGEEVESRASRPLTAASSRATSRTSRPSDPTWSRELAKAMMP